jgi:serine/threonine protein kinase/CheY-like chemotaxis protein
MTTSADPRKPKDLGLSTDNTTVDPVTAGANDPPELRIGGKLGKYLLTAKIGQGAEGVVYRGLHPALNMSVAIKVIKTAGRQIDERVYRQFTAEAQTLAQFSHPNIVRVLDFDDNPSQPFLVLEFIEGLNLAELITQSGRLSLERTLDIITQITKGLEAAHAHNVIHRDVKPSNVLMTKDGVAKVVDLGTALLLSPGNEAEQKNRIVGTALYMAPEQFTGQAPVDHRSDIYALGSTFYHCLTGRPPFVGRSTTEVMIHKQQVRDNPALLVLPHEVNAQIPVQVSDLIQQMLEPDPQDRPSSYAELLREFAELSGLVNSIAAVSNWQPNAKPGKPGLNEQTNATILSSTRRSSGNININTQDVPTWIKYAEEAARRGDQALARRFLGAAQAREPKNEQVLLLLAQNAETPQQARTLLEAALREVPNSAKLQEAMQRLAPPASRKCPFCSTAFAKTESVCPACGARDNLNDPHAWFNSPPPKPAVLARAVPHYEKLAAERPSLMSTLVLALSYLNARRFDEAIPALQAVLKFNPGLTNVITQIQVLEQQAVPEVPALRKPTVVVVDDSPTVRKMVASKLNNYDYNVVGIEDGDGAIAQLGLIKPDLVLLDIQMPGKDGYQVCKWIRSQPELKQTTVVMLSGSDGFFDKIRGRMAGASRHISKPFDMDVLLQVVDLYCHKSK